MCAHTHARTHTHTSTKQNWHAPSHTPLTKLAFPSVYTAPSTQCSTKPASHSPSRLTHLDTLARTDPRLASSPGMERIFGGGGGGGGGLQSTHTNSHACVPLNLHTPRNVHTTCVHQHTLAVHLRNLSRTNLHNGMYTRAEKFSNFR